MTKRETRWFGYTPRIIASRTFPYVKIDCVEQALNYYTLPPTVNAYQTVLLALEVKLILQFHGVGAVIRLHIDVRPRAQIGEQLAVGGW